MSKSSAADLRAWSAESIDASTNWYFPLPREFMSAVEPILAEQRRSPRPITEVSLPTSLRQAAHEQMQPALHALEQGRGFVILTGPRPEELPDGEASLLYWLVGQALGRPFAQNVQGIRLYDVRDTGQDVAYGARFSVTNAESSFHTDNSFGVSVLDYVGLLCLRGARAGGLSQLVSGWTVRNGLAGDDPAALATLGRPFHFDRRGGLLPGETPTIRFPVLAGQNGDLLYRYLRYWIEAGHQKVNEPLTPEQKRALDALDDWVNRPELRVEFLMRPGEMLFVNNRWLLHNRTAFDDHETLERRRHYVRLWLQIG
jgi:hypothetical protein